MFRADHPLDNQRGGVCVYYKENLPIRLYNISYLKECTSFNLMISNKLCNIVLLYRSPSQNSNKFENFINNLNLALESITERKPFSTTLLGYFIAKHNRTIVNVAPQLLLSQIIKEPTHISQAFSSCIDLIFTNQPHLVTDLGVHPSLHSKCPH